ncbi:MAG: OadG-related small transporter subunit [Anaerorhabdus sp.]
MNLNFNMADISPALEIMVVGMGGIFAALLIIYAASIVLLKCFPTEKK